MGDYKVRVHKTSPKPEHVKKEKTEDQYCPLSLQSYLDDRLEMVKQMFGSLKPKTIANLAPEFLKNKSMVDIEEGCLDALVRISTKRLKSVIDGTQCPSDTESSGDDNSDVQQQDEHLSLEEISSDSEFEGKNKSSTVSGNVDRDYENNNVKKSGIEKNGKNQISVLELLELQARARAIRSQLALEPITKIEVDSDLEAESKRKIRKDKRRNSRSKAKSSSKKDDAREKSWPKKDISPTNNSPPSNKPIVNSKNRDEECCSHNSNEKTKHNVEIVDKAEWTRDRKVNHSVSPDVIPIEEQPETVLISDTSDVETNNLSGIGDNIIDKSETKNDDNSKQVHRSAKPQRNIDSELEEGELVDSYDESDKEVEVQDINKKPTTEEESINRDNDKSCPDDAKLNIDLSSQDVEIQAVIDESDENVLCDNRKMDNEIISENVVNDNALQQIDNNEESDNLKEECIVLEEDGKGLIPSDSVLAEGENITPVEVRSHDNEMVIDGDDEQNDDVISIEGGDLENEIESHLENDIDSRNSSSVLDSAKGSSVLVEKSSNQKEKTLLESSCRGAQIKDTESWHARYIKSSKVSKVLATSRLNKRVRDKIKNYKKISHETEDTIYKDSSKEVFVSKHEDGSVEQYFEILKSQHL